METTRRAAPDQRRVVVLGLGNPIRRDDAAGLEVLRLAAMRLAGSQLGRTVCWKECCAAGFDLLCETLGFDALVIADAWHTEESEPGRVHVLTPFDLTSAGVSPTNPHLVGFPQLLGWGERVGLGVPQLHSIVVIEVGVECMEFGEGLTEPVRAAVPEAARALERAVHAAVAATERRSLPREVSP